MMADFIALLGPWTWVVLGLVLLGIEIVLPSTFLLWPGIAAMIVGFVTLILGVDSSIWPWQAQVLVFLVLSLIVAYFGRKIWKDNHWDKSEVEGLNERGAQLIGQMGVLTDAIANGHGRVKIGDTTWRVRGEDAKAGSKVRVVSADAGTLDVESV